MSLADEIEGYVVIVARVQPDLHKVLLDQRLKLSKVGGAKVKNAEALIMQIEDAVYQQEKKEADELVRKHFDKET